jgi:SAM-dependent methyltransferase
MFFLGNRTEAGSFEQFASVYDTIRPDYPPEVLRALLQEFGCGPKTKVLEVGAGTGLATRHILETGAVCHAIEPGENLLSIAQQKLQEFPSLVLRHQSFEDLVPGGDYDLVVAATAFHWLSPSERFAKVDALLKKQGALLLLWNTFFTSQGRAAQAVVEYYHSVFPEGEASNPNEKALTKLLGREQEIRDSKLFFAESTRRAVTTYEYTSSQYCALLNTFPNIANLHGDKRHAFLTDVASIVDQYEGSIEVPVLTSGFLCRRVADFVDLMGYDKKRN